MNNDFYDAISSLFPATFLISLLIARKPKLKSAILFYLRVKKRKKRKIIMRVGIDTFSTIFPWQC
jgi:hypothetical protein